MIKYFILSDPNGIPAKIAMGLYKDNIKVKGHPMLPKELTGKETCFDELEQVRKSTCNCGNPFCIKNKALAQAIKEFTKETFH